jgi:hypothetical protein
MLYAKQTLQYTCPYRFFTGKNKWAIAKAIEIANILTAIFILYTLYTRPIAATFARWRQAFSLLMNHMPTD